MGRNLATLQWRVRRCIGMVLDVIHRVETSAIVPVGSLGVTSPNRDRGVAYDPSPWRILHRSLRLTGMPAPNGFTFVDIGCGKGKVVLSAMAFPFKKIIGIDFSPYLCEIARRNLLRARLLRKFCKDVEIACLDAIEWQPPDEPLMLFFYNPFDAKIMEQVIRNLVHSYLPNPRPIVIVFFKSSFAGNMLEHALTETYCGPKIGPTSGRFRDDSVRVYCLPAPNRTTHLR